MKKITLQALVFQLGLLHAQTAGDLESLDADRDLPPTEESALTTEMPKDEGPELEIDEPLDLDKQARPPQKTAPAVTIDEKKLLELAAFVQGKIPDSEWNEVADRLGEDRYVVQKGDYLWKISQRFFGSGFYYAKIWSLNPQITNPHEIEPGMVLLFDTEIPPKCPKYPWEPLMRRP